VTGLGAAVTFSWNEAEDADGDSVRYELYVATRAISPMPLSMRWRDPPHPWPRARGSCYARAPPARVHRGSRRQAPEILGHILPACPCAVLFRPGRILSLSSRPPDPSRTRSPAFFRDRPLLGSDCDRQSRRRTQSGIRSSAPRRRASGVLPPEVPPFRMLDIIV